MAYTNHSPARNKKTTRPTALASARNTLGGIDDCDDLISFPVNPVQSVGTTTKIIQTVVHPAPPSNPSIKSQAIKYSTTQNTSEITECSICLGTFIKPKSLPCIHTFCLECLSNCGKTAKPGSQMPCPLCRQLFIIPSAGFAAIPNNQFIEHILETEAILAITTQGCEIWCELCDEDEGNNSVATGYCMECRQNLCQKCSGRHRKSQFAKTHNIVALEDRRRSQNITKLHKSYCTTHNEEQLKLFCYDCKQTVCLMCFAIGHNGHKCSDISESTETFRKQLIKDNENMNKAIISTKNELEILNSDTSKHLHQIVIAQQNIAKQCSELKAFIDSQQKQLELELNKLKETRLGQIETRRADLTSKLVTMQSFVQYSKELMEKGSMCDIARSANDLFLRSDQLLKDQTAFNKIKLYKYELEFVPTNLTDKSITLGAIQLNGKPG